MAAIPGFRFDVTGASGSQGFLGPRQSWRAYVFPRGANASQDSTGTLITFDSAAIASRFAANNWIQIGTNTANIRRVTAVGGNSMSINSAVTVSENGRVFLIGNTQPSTSGGSATYTTPNTLVRQRGDDAAALYANSMITTNADGLVQGYAAPAMYDVIVQDGNQGNQGYIADLEVGTVEGVSVIDAAYFGSTVTFSGNMTGVSVTGAAIFGSTVTINGALGVTGWATFGSSVTMHANLGVTGSVVTGGSVTVGGNLLVSGAASLVAALGNIRWAHLYATGSSTGGIQEAINGITDSSATNRYTVMLRPGVYTVDLRVDGGTQTGTAGFTSNNTNVTGVSTLFQSTQVLGGTVTMTTGNTAVTGVGTSFLTALQVTDYLQLTTDTNDGAGTDRSGLFGSVKSIESNTALTLDSVGGVIYDGAGGTGAARFREFRVNDHIRAGTHAATADTRITSIASDTSLTVSGLEAIPPVTGYQGATALGAAVVKSTYEHDGIATQGKDSNGDRSTGANARDYIAIAGMDQETCIIRRNKASNLLTAVIQAGGPGAHQSLSNLTIQCNGTRHVHWDTASGYLRCNAVTFRSAPAAANSAAISTGIGSTAAESAYHRITNCHFEYTTYACHSQVDVDGALASFIWLTANTFTNSGTLIGLDMGSAGANSLYHIMLSGNIQQSFNVDHGNGAVDLIMPTTVGRQPNIRIYTDGALRFANSSLVSGLTTSNTADYFWNAVIYPMEHKSYQDVIGSSSGDVLIFRPASADLGTTTTIAAQWPVVVCNLSDNTGSANWFPRLCTGPNGACFVEAGTTVTVGDVLVTSGTSWSAGVSNTITDMTRVIGWAFSGKTAGTTRGLVNFRRNMTLAW